MIANGAVCNEGFLLIGLASQLAPSGGFLGGYLATKHTGKVTRAHGRSHALDLFPCVIFHGIATMAWLALRTRP